MIRSGFRLGISPVLAAFSSLMICLPSTADAHLVTTGMGPVYDGIGHLLMTPEDLVPVIAAALYAGLRGPASGRSAMFLLPIAWFMGGIAGSSIIISGAFPISVVSFLVLGGLVATDLCLPASAVTGLLCLFGLAYGWMNGSALQDTAGALGLIGIAAMLFVIIAVVSAVVVSLKKPWERIIIRVTGSWITAVGLLMIGWTLRFRAMI